MKSNKFRAWHEEEGAMFYSVDPDTAAGDCGFETTRDGFKFHFPGDLTLADGRTYVSNLPTDYRVMMNTGQRDKLDYEIYEGDILLDKDGHLYTVEWDNSQAGFQPWIENYRMDDDPILSEECEIVGNLWEESDKLKDIRAKKIEIYCKEQGLDVVKHIVEAEKEHYLAVDKKGLYSIVFRMKEGDWGKLFLSRDPGMGKPLMNEDMAYITAVEALRLEKTMVKV